MVLVAAGQITSTSSLVENGQTVVKLISKAVELGVKILFLPEASDYIAKDANHSKSIAVSVEKSPFILAIQSKLKELHSIGKLIEINVGIHEPSLNSDRVRNTSIWLNSKGEITQRYQKIHLFDVNISGKVTVTKESDSVEPGDNILEPFDTIAGKVGLAICYDLRFPELAMRLRSLGADILTYPSAFTMRTGPAHWHLLGRARAIDSQSYVILPAQSGQHTHEVANEDGSTTRVPTRITYGHSLIVDPWGTVVSEVGDVEVGKSALAIADIDLELVEKVRRDMPLWQQRRPDVFGYEV